MLRLAKAKETGRAMARALGRSEKAIGMRLFRLRLIERVSAGV